MIEKGVKKKQKLDTKRRNRSYKRVWEVDYSSWIVGGLIRNSIEIKALNDKIFVCKNP